MSRSGVSSECDTLHSVLSAQGKEQAKRIARQMLASGNAKEQR